MYDHTFRISTFWNEHLNALYVSNSGKRKIPGYEDKPFPGLYRDCHKPAPLNVKKLRLWLREWSAHRWGLQGELSLSEALACSPGNDERKAHTWRLRQLSCKQNWANSCPQEALCRVHRNVGSKFTVSSTWPLCAPTQPPCGHVNVPETCFQKEKEILW